MTSTLEDWAGAPPHEATLPALLEHHTRVHPHQVALVEEDISYTFKELSGSVSRLVEGWSQLGVAEGDVVALWLPSSVQWAQAALASAYHGAVTFGVNTLLRSRDVLHALEDSHARVLVVWPSFKGIDFLGMLGEIADALPATLRNIVIIEDGEEAVPESLRERVVQWHTLAEGDDASVPTPVSVATPLRPAQAFSSSGTTSAPKLVLQSHRSLVTHSYAVAHAFGYTAADTVVLGALPFCGVFGYNTLFAALAAGRPLVIQPVFGAAASVDLIRRHRVTHTNLSDEMLRRIIETAPLDSMPTWREAGFGNFTAVDAHTLVAAGARAGKKFFQTYGASEVLAVMTYPRPDSGPERWGTGGGIPVSSEIRVRIRDLDTGGPAAAGGVGEIEVSGPNVTCGYLNRDGIEDLAEDGFFRTGDLGRLGPGGDLVYLSRRGDALRLGGFLVSPREIETFLEEDPAVREAQVVGVDTPGGLAMVAFVLGDPASFDESTVIAGCRRELARFKVPRRVVVLEEFPMSRGANGNKIQRTVLREMAATVMEEGVTSR